MAYIDVKLHYNQIEQQYLQMVEMMNRVDKEYKDNKITQEQFDVLSKQIQVIKSNYERISYIMFLFNIPKSKKNKHKFSSKTNKLEKGYNLLQSDRNTIINENTYVLKEIEKVLNNLECNEWEMNI